MRSNHCLARATALLLLLVVGGCSTTPSPPPPPSPSRSPPSARGAVAPRSPTLSSEQAHDITIHALGLVGTPYRYGGNTPDSGFDCSGLIGYVYQSRAGKSPPRTVAQLDQWGLPIAAQALRSGDLVVFGRGRAPNHAGIYVGEGRFVHAPSSGGTVRLDRLDAKHWAGQKPAFRRP